MATICFYCVLCGTSLSASSESAEDLTECRSCLRQVPVPRLASLLGKVSDYLPVFPPEVIELALEFECVHCHARLSADARWEGRGVTCPKCEAKIGIPRWSTGRPWSRSGEAMGTAVVTRLPIDAQAAKLSSEEVDFLSGRESENAGATR